MVEKAIREMAEKPEVRQRGGDVSVDELRDRLGNPYNSREKRERHDPLFRLLKKLQGEGRLQWVELDNPQEWLHAGGSLMREARGALKSEDGRYYYRVRLLKKDA